MNPVDDGGPVRLSTVGMVDILGDAKALLPVDLVYDPSDPLAVTMVLGGQEGEEEVRWTFAWDLLTAGLVAPAGEGDVRVGPVAEASHGPEVALALPHGVNVRLPKPGTASFVRGLHERRNCDAEKLVGEALDLALAVILTET